MSTYKLSYFNARGRAEISRLLFAAAGQKFEDVRIEQAQWPARQAGTPLGQVPVLEYNGIQIPQSTTIARFLAKQFHLAGRDHLEQAQVDAVVDTINELFSAYFSRQFVKDEKEKREFFQKFFADDLAKYLKNLQTLAKLYSNGCVYFVGDRLTWADLLFYDVSQTLLDINPNCLNDYPWLRQNRAEVEKQPRIAVYLRNRAKTPF